MSASGTATLAEIIAAHPFNPTHPCSVCRMPVLLTLKTPRDSNGRAMHEECARFYQRQEAA